MGTRGLFGFYFKGKYYVCYNHWDSYPSGLGKDLINELSRCIKLNQLDEWIVMLKKLRIVDCNTEPTPDDILRLEPFTDTSVGSGTRKDWYCVLRKTQGSFERVLKSGYLLNHVDENGEPEFEEFAYIVNFDDRSFDFYQGSSWIASFSLDHLRTNAMLNDLFGQQ